MLRVIFGALIDYGTDGEGSVGYTLELSGDDIGSGLYALDATDTDAGDGDGIGQGSEILLSADGDDIVGMADGVEYFRISVDGDGDVTFEQSNNIWHDTTSDDDEPETLTLSDEDTFEVVQTVTDADGDSDTAAVSLGSGVFTIQDDGPDAVVEDTTVAELVLDESPVDDPDTVVVEGDGVVSATVNVAGNFGALIDYGTDGEGSVGYTLELSGDDIGSGLYALDATDTDAGDGDGIGQGSEILLSADGDDIVGMADGVEYFRISVDGDGDVTFEQSNNIWHDTTSDDDEPETLTLSDEDTFEVVQTVTDADGDSDTAAVSLGSGVFTIQDDGPDAVVEDTTVAELVLDESPVDDPDTVVVEGDGVVSATVNVAGNFGALIDYGTDGEGSVGYTLELSGDDIGSGLYALDATDTDAGDGDGIGQGSEILLSADGDDIVGMADGVEYFRISVDGDGDVTFEQSNNIWHDTTSDDDEPETLTLSDEDTFEVVQTVTDADGDSDTAAVSLGSGVFTIQDDGPDAVVEDTTVAELVLDESPVDDPDTVVVEGDGVVSATVNVAGNFGALIDYGTDGEGSVGYTLELSGDDIGSGLYALDATDTDAGDGDGIGQGSEILLSADGDDIVGMADGVEYFRISVDGDGDVTFEQSNNIWHDTTSDDDEPETLTLSDEDTFEVVQTVTDADGDSDTAAVSLGSGVFTIQDDGPDAVVEDTTVAELVLDESPVDDPDTVVVEGDGVVSATVNVAGNFGALIDYGTDGEGSVGYTLELSGDDIGSGLYALDATDTDAGDGDGIGQGSEILLSADGDDIVGMADGVEYFRISVDGDGDVTFEQSNNIWHDTTSDDDEPETLTLSDEDTFEVVQTVTDADGDSDTAAVSLGSGVFTIQDDGPDAVVEDTTVAELVLDESPVDDPDTVVVEGDGVVSATVNVAGNFGALIDYGTDGEGSVGYTLELSGDDIGSGLYALDATDTDAGDGDGIGQGSEILLSADGDDIVGMADGVEYFRISVDGDGDVTFEQSNNIWHDTTSDDDEPETLTLSDEDTFEVVQTVTDADGDSDTAAVSLGSGVFTIQDDGPDAVVEDTTVCGTCAG